MASEIVFGLVGALGTPLDLLGSLLNEKLKTVGYETRLVQVTDELRKLPAYSDLPSRNAVPRDEYLEKMIESGDKLCADTGMPQAMAALAVTGIRRVREEISGKDSIPAEKTAYVIRSLKRPDEVRLLRDVYGPQFILIAAYAPRCLRVEELSRQIAASRHDSEELKYRPSAEHLVQLDDAESEDGKDFGQNVRLTFPLADVFIDFASPSEAPAEIERFIQLLFGHPYHTPTRSEAGMFFAHGASRLSADLSRQVGAAIMSVEGDVVAVGTNDAPKHGGGLYWGEDPGQQRDHVIGSDSSYLRRRQLLGDALQRLKKKGWLGGAASDREVDALVAEALEGPVPFLRDAELMDVTEYGRSVHAEMAAITAAARRGVALKDTILFCTTFPCHNCARHIVSVGISSVVYIEPYPKSQAGRLFGDSVAVDPHSQETGRVPFNAFVGIGPRLYLDLFAAPKRKAADGKSIAWSPSESRHRFVSGNIGYLEQELVPVSNLAGAIEPILEGEADESGADKPTE